MKKVTIILKSGARFSFKCDDFQVTYSKETGEVQSYHGKNVRGAVPTYIVPPEIAAVLVKT